MKTLLPFLALVLLAVGPGCKKKKNLDKQVDALIETLNDCDYSALKDISDPSLLDDLAESKFKAQCDVMKRLGKLEERTMKGIDVKSGGIAKGTYSLDLERAQVELEITLKDDKLVAFRLTGEHVKSAMAEARKERFKDFAVHHFQFVDSVEDKPNPSGNVFAVGKRVRFHLKVAGVTAKDGKFQLGGDVTVKDPKGAIVRKYPGGLKYSVEAKEGQAPIVGLSPWLEGIPAGTHTLELLIEDTHSGKTLTYSQGLVVK